MIFFFNVFPKNLWNYGYNNLKTLTRFEPQIAICRILVVADTGCAVGCLHSCHQIVVLTK